VAPRAVVFDFFGTLTRPAPAAVWDEHAARSAAPLGIPAARWRRALDESWPERATGALGGLPETFRVLARRCGADPGPGALAAACAARRACQGDLIRDLRPDTERTLHVLHSAGIAVAVVSDCTVELAEAWPELPASALVAARVLSCEEGRRKPDPELFLAAASRLGVPAEDCLYVGDGGGNELAGASAVGMTACLLRAGGPGDGARGNRERSWAGPVLPGLASVIAMAGLPGPDGGQ
jgi:putative hydrolase of the HAD superfamily